MLKHILYSTAAVGALGLATHAMAQSDTRPYCDEGYVAADTNDDGIITEAELVSASSAEFSDLDADGDGTVSQEEYTSCLGAWSANAVTEPADDQDLAEFDTNGDGELSADEFMGGLQETSNMRVDQNSAQATSATGSDMSGSMPEEQVFVLRRIVLVPGTYDDERVYGMSDDEMSARASQRFEASDTNMDNTLSRDEWAASGEELLDRVRAQLRSRYADKFAAIDADQSGDITEKEYYSAGAQQWERAKLSAEQKGTQSTERGAPVVYFRFPSPM